MLVTAQSNDITDIEALEQHLKRTNPAYRRRPSLPFRKLVEKAVWSVQQAGSNPKPDLQLQVHSIPPCVLFSVKI